MILISSCLIGENVRYDGGNQLDVRLKKLIDSGKAIHACPELLGGLLIPREPAEIIVEMVLMCGITLQRLLLFLTKT